MGTVAADVITPAFRKINIDSPTVTHMSNALTSLNELISMWGADGMNYVPVAESFSITAADGEYTIGSGGDFDTVRPLRINTCYLRDSDSYDYPVGVMSASEYANIRNKSLSLRPTKVYLLPEYPLAKLIFNTLPDASYTGYFEFTKNFTEYAATTTAFGLPPEYKEALVYNLALSLAADWDRVVSQFVASRALETKLIIERLNASMQPIPESKFDIMMIGGVNYDIAVDALVDGGEV